MIILMRILEDLFLFFLGGGGWEGEGRGRGREGCESKRVKARLSPLYRLTLSQTHRLRFPSSPSSPHLSPPFPFPPPPTPPAPAFLPRGSGRRAVALSSASATLRISFRRLLTGGRRATDCSRSRRRFLFLCLEGPTPAPCDTQRRLRLGPLVE